VTREAVLLVHGHAAPAVLLEPLRRALARQGFRAVNWRYDSLRGSIEAHAARLAAKARELDEDAAVERLHFVGHSMGAIVVGVRSRSPGRASSAASCCWRRPIAARGLPTSRCGCSARA
jgi:pimeloyl-ACP methyl ester carboxylesterase